MAVLGKKSYKQDTKGTDPFSLASVFINIQLIRALTY